MSLEQLRTKTGPLHAQLETRLNLFDVVSTRRAYIEHLVRLYQWLRPLEDRIDPFAKRMPLQWKERQKSRWIEADLSALGCPIPGPAEVALPDCTTEAECLGISYVLEGSSLGAQLITRHYAESLKLTSDDGLRYFSGYGEETRIMWQSFLKILTSTFAERPECTEKIISSACATFHSYSEFVPFPSELP